MQKYQVWIKKDSDRTITTVFFAQNEQDAKMLAEKFYNKDSIVRILHRGHHCALSQHDQDSTASTRS